MAKWENRHIFDKGDTSSFMFFFQPVMLVNSGGVCFRAMVW